MSALPPALEARIQELADCADLEERYDRLIEMGQEVPDLDAEHKVPANQVLGCQSLVHVVASLKGDGTLSLRGHADAMIVNGLLALLVLGLDGLTPQAFLAVDPRFLERSGVVQALTPSRTNGFYNIHQKLKAQVQALAAGRA